MRRENKLKNKIWNKRRYGGFLFCILFLIGMGSSTVQGAIVREGFFCGETVKLNGMAVCENCGKNAVCDTFWEDWQYAEKEQCIHGYAWGGDMEKVRAGKQVTICAKCKTCRETEVEEKEVECHGFNQ